MQVKNSALLLLGLLAGARAEDTVPCVATDVGKTQDFALFKSSRLALRPTVELLADTDYQKFRAMVRSQGWQRDFLSQPLQQRLALARGLRAQSEARKTTSTDFFDVDSDAAAAWLAQAHAATLIHGHTHRPAEHLIPRPEAPGTAHQNLRRIVLSDWDASATPPRLEVLRLDLSQAGLVSRVDLTLSQ